MTSESTRSRLPRARWFSQAAVVLAVTGIGVRFGVPAYRQYVAVSEIKEVGGEVFCEPRPSCLREYVGDRILERFGEVKGLMLAGVSTADSILAYVGRFPELCSVNLNASGVTDDGLASLGKAPRIEALSLEFTRVTDAGVVHLAMPVEADGFVTSWDASHRQRTDAPGKNARSPHA